VHVSRLRTFAYSKHPVRRSQDLRNIDNTRASKHRGASTSDVFYFRREHLRHHQFEEGSGPPYVTVDIPRELGCMCEAQPWQAASLLVCLTSSVLGQGMILAWPLRRGGERRCFEITCKQFLSPVSGWRQRHCECEQSRLIRIIRNNTHSLDLDYHTINEKILSFTNLKFSG